MENIKTHLKGIRNVLLCYVLTVVLAWAAFPLIVIALSGYMTPDFWFSVYTLFSTVVFCIITYCIMHGFGEDDRKPYKWVRYPWKGLVCGAISFVIIVLLEYVMIGVANEYVIVSHPKFVIEVLNAYVRIALCMPFYWFFRLIEGPVGVLCPIPSVSYWNCLIPGVLIIGIAGFGYFMGFTGRRIIKWDIKNKFLHNLLYPKPKRVRKEEKERRKAAKKKQ